MTRPDAFVLSPEAATREHIAQATVRVPGCCGATSETWVRGRLTGRVSSHPDLGELMAVEPQLADSPMRSAARTLRTVRIDDTAADRHWRPFSARAVHLGVRSLVCVPLPTAAGEAMTCTLYSLRPSGLPEHAGTLANDLLVAWTTTLAQASAFADVQAEAQHLTEAIAARELVEQAKGMLMHALNCDADTAYRELEAAATRGQTRITDVARRLVEHRSAPPGPDPRRRSGRGGLTPDGGRRRHPRTGNHNPGRSADNPS